MGTRGFITFVIDGTEKTAYNHWDSYPDGLGAAVLHFLQGVRDNAVVSDGKTRVEAFAGLAAQARALRVVASDSRATYEDVARLTRFADPGVSTKDLHEWYVLLRRTQGSPGLMLDAGVIEDAHEFPRDSLFAEWGYVIDLDARRFEVYEGFQKQAHGKGRFAGREGDGGYFPVALLASWSLDELPNDEAFAAATSGPEDED